MAFTEGMFPQSSKWYDIFALLAQTDKLYVEVLCDLGIQIREKQSKTSLSSRMDQNTLADSQLNSLHDQEEVTFHYDILLALWYHENIKKASTVVNDLVCLLCKFHPKFLNQNS